MTPQALFLGSIGVLAETSDIQRRAYNQAMAEAGLDWHWDVATYRALLVSAGGKARLHRLAAADNKSLAAATVDQIHRRKTEIACAEVVRDRTPLRIGVAALIRAALERDIALALVTTTYRPNIDAIAAAHPDELPLDRFAAVLTVDDVARGKPAPDIYELALERTGVRAEDALAIEDSAASVAAARAAGVYTVAIPGRFTQGQDFSGANERLDSLAGFAFD